jgi:HB1, ASXL, restriction endonuclease HTH domain
MTYFEAALEVLKTARKPLSLREITERALERGLVVPQGKTPQRTMGAALYERLGTDPRLVRTADPGQGRGKPGTVRWALREKADRTN